MKDFEITAALEEKLAQAQNMEEVAAACREEGMDVTVEDLKKAQELTADELDADALDGVSGGCPGAVLVLTVAIFILGVWLILKAKQKSKKK